MEEGNRTGAATIPIVITKLFILIVEEKEKPPTFWHNHKTVRNAIRKDIYIA